MSRLVWFSDQDAQKTILDYAFTERNHNDDTNSSLQNITQDPGLFFKALQKRFCDNHGQWFNLP